jgi:hypothetical protein
VLELWFNSFRTKFSICVEFLAHSSWLLSAKNLPWLNHHS